MTNRLQLRPATQINVIKNAVPKGTITTYATPKKEAIIPAIKKMHIKTRGLFKIITPPNPRKYNLLFFQMLLLLSRIFS